MCVKNNEKLKITSEMIRINIFYYAILMCTISIMTTKNVIKI